MHRNATFFVFRALAVGVTTTCARSVSIHYSSGPHPRMATPMRTTADRSTAAVQGSPAGVKRFVPPPPLPVAWWEIAKRFDDDPVLVFRVVERLSPQQRRYMLVVATTNEYLGPKSVDRQLLEADCDKDNVISCADYDNWIWKVVSGGRPQIPPLRVLLSIGFRAALPFVAFGFLDNSMLVLSGDAIGLTIGQAFGLSAMTAAALGGLVSGTFGIQVHGIVANVLARRVRKEDHVVDTPQRHPYLFHATHIGGSVGLCVGLALGMLPLLFIKHDHDAEEKGDDEKPAEPIL